MAEDVIEIEAYEYYVFSSRDLAFPAANAAILLYGANRYLGAAVFYKDNSRALPPATKYPGGIYGLYYSYVDLPVIVDMLRNERPVYLIYDTTLWPAVNARISAVPRPWSSMAVHERVGVETLQEPVGEGEQPP